MQAAWTKWREEQKEYNRKVSEARTKLNAERRVADLSVTDHDPTGYDGTEYTKDATVTANVRMPDGQTAEKTYTLTLQRVVLKDPQGGADIEGKWMIHGDRRQVKPPWTGNRDSGTRKERGVAAPFLTTLPQFANLAISVFVPTDAKRTTSNCRPNLDAPTVRRTGWRTTSMWPGRD